MRGWHAPGRTTTTDSRDIFDLLDLVEPQPGEAFVSPVNGYRRLLRDVFGIGSTRALRYTCGLCAEEHNGRRRPLVCRSCGAAGGILIAHCLYCGKPVPGGTGRTALHPECRQPYINGEPEMIRRLAAMPVARIVDALGVQFAEARKLRDRLRTLRTA